VARFVAFLRGMNLGSRRLTNEELRGHLAALGHPGAGTFRASGNVILDAAETEGALASQLEAGLAERLGYEVKVFLRGAEELRAIAAQEPFAAAAVAAAQGGLQVQLLASEPGRDARAEALALAGPEDPLSISGREVYWLPARGVSGSELDLRAMERALGPGTIRTMGTISQLAGRI
jgi:uncharacterized protein (DUF1697 family)